MAGNHRICPSLAQEHGAIRSIAVDNVEKRHMAEAIFFIPIRTVFDQQHADLERDVIGCMSRSVPGV